MQTSSCNSTDYSRVNILEQLVRDFDIGKIYGLEYIAEDLNRAKNKNDSEANSFDWFGLNDLTRM